MHPQETDHQHEGEHQTPGFHGDGEREVIPGRKWHKDWRVWAVVLLMLAAISTYVLTQNDSFSMIGSPRAKTVAPETAHP